MKFKSYYVTEIPLSTWRKLRVRAMTEGITIRALFMRWIQNYAEGK